MYTRGSAFKRPRLDLNDQNNASIPAIYTVPPSESTLAFRTGDDTQNPGSPFYGNSPALSLAAGLNSGGDVLQYDEFFWMNDQFTFNTRNSAIGVAVMCWVDPTATSPVPAVGIRQQFFCEIIPVILPWQKLSFGNLDNTFDPEAAGTTKEGRKTFRRLQEQLVYALNLQWNSEFTTPAGAAPPFSIVGNRWVLNQYLFNQVAIDSPNFPLWQGVASGNAPPLIWFLGPNGELGLKRNGTFNDGSRYGYYRFAISFVTLRKLFFPSIGYNIRKTTPAAPVVSPCVDSPNYIASLLETPNGWIGYGPNVYGVGSFNSDYASTSSGGYVDQYETNSTMLNFLWATTTYPGVNSVGGGIPTLANYAAFKATSKSAGLNEGLAMGPRMCSLTPNRYYTITSQALCRSQRMKIESNNSALANSSVLTVVFPPNANNDENLFVKTNTLQNYIDPSSTNRNPTIHINPSDPTSVIDFSIRDERDNFIRNPNTQMESFFDYSLLRVSQRNNLPPNSFNGNAAIPNAFKALNPDPTSYPTGDCMVGYNHMSQFPIFAPVVMPQNFTKDNQINITCLTGSWMNHFVRIIGNS